ncbi:MAG: ribosome biogenesis GTP-binding protein YihA/YsxC [Betaproteobacteria bacterium]|jgi:GTP-binding protein
MSKLQQAKFFVTVNHLADLPKDPLPEIAFAGRSNAGKSTAINVLCSQKRLAFASKTPGRTQHINFFCIPEKDTLLGHLVDLPGYGYAKVDRKVRAHWETLLSKYLQERSQLKAMVLIVDSRRGITDLDRNMLEWFCPTGKPVHLLITKCDKLNLSEKALAMKAVRDELKSLNDQHAHFGELSAQLFSSTKRIGLEQADELVCKWLVS